MKTLILMLFMALPALAQQITAGPAIAATATSPAWVIAKTYCPSFNQAAPITATVNTAQLTAPTPPQSALQNEVYAPVLVCTFTGLVANAQYTLTWVGSEGYWTTTGARNFSATANTVSLFSGLDIFAAAGGQNIAIQRTATVTADATGTIVLTMTATADQAKFDALILTPAAPPAPLAATLTVAPDGTKTIVVPPGAQLPAMSCQVGLAGGAYFIVATPLP